MCALSKFLPFGAYFVFGPLWFEPTCQVKFYVTNKEWAYGHKGALAPEERGAKPAPGEEEKESEEEKKERERRRT